MKNAVILDFMGVIADCNYFKLILDTPLKDKLSSGRLLLRLIQTHDVKKIFELYKSGEVNQDELTRLLVGKDEKLNPLVHSILKRIPDYITPNESVIEKMKELKNNGAKIIILSNTIPETEAIIKALKLEDICDDIVCSTQLGLTKPDLKIFNYVIVKHNLNPNHTIYVDDSKKNLESAQSLGIQTFHVKNSSETDLLLDDYMFYIDFVNSCIAENIAY